MAKALKESILPYFGTWLATFKSCWALRLEFLISIVVTLLVAIIMRSLWLAIHSASETVQTAFTSSEMVSYVVMSQIINLARIGHTNRRIVYGAMARIVSGQVAMDLIRPQVFQLTRYAEWLAVLTFDALVVGLPLWIVFRLAGWVPNPASPLHGLLFVVSMAAAWLVMSGIHYVIVVVAFKSTNVFGIQMARVALQEVLGGSLIPISLMPGALLAVASVLPFQALVFTPVWIYMGRVEGVDLARALLVQWGWAAFLAVAGVFIWTYVRPRVLVFGG